ncbi:ABC transporter ATP-binding protein [Brachybacterium sp. GCM10030268]|uniref:ABC transporter ATP-binding protein n=1 Tax=Brachybacterium sp. GCM10030268 TaxID=3273382 RepID=UPI003613C226
MRPLLEATGLHHAFGTHAVLRGVDITAGEGEVVGLVGPNGSGKTTALRILHRALVPQSGRVLLDGQDLASCTSRERARQIAVMAQEAPGDVPLTVADVVLLGRIPHRGSFGGRTEEDLAVAADALRRTGAEQLARQEFGSLSGGERQRVLMARVLAQQARLLLLDEPTNHLDIGSQHQVLTLVREQGAATVVVLHDLNLAARYCDRVIVLAGGRVQADGPPQDVLRPELVGSLYDVGVDRRIAEDLVPQFLFRPPKETS